MCNFDDFHARCHVTLWVKFARYFNRQASTSQLLHHNNKLQPSSITTTSFNHHPFRPRAIYTISSLFIELFILSRVLPTSLPIQTFCVGQKHLVRIASTIPAPFSMFLYECNPEPVLEATVRNTLSSSTIHYVLTYFRVYKVFSLHSIPH